jgi:Na+-driven multidrug efflux pump
MGGRLLGARDYSALWELTKKIVFYGLVVSIAMIIGGVLLYGKIGQLFSHDLQVLESFGSIFFILLLALPINTVAFVLDGLFKGLGEMKFLRNLLLSATFLGFVPVIYLGHYFNWQLYGIWAAFTIWMSIRAGALVWKFRRKFRPLVQNV